jgi:large subunit ribosomal protein L10
MRAEKQLLLDEIKEKISGSKGFIIARYQGLTAQKARAFRDSVAAANGDFEVVKKRVFSKAAKEAGVEIGGFDYEGHVGVIFASEDSTLTLSKIAVKYGEDNEKAVEILGGMIDGQFCSGADVVQLTKLPSLEQMRAEVLGLLQAPLSGTLGVIQANLSSLLYCLDEKAKKGEQAE